MALDPVTAAFEVGGKLIDKFWPDASEAEKTKQQQFLAVFVAQADIVKTEAASNHWLAANWRPLLMLTFGGLIVARWFGLAAPGLSEAEYLNCHSARWTQRCRNNRWCDLLDGVKPIHQVISSQVSIPNSAASSIASITRWTVPAH